MSASHSPIQLTKTSTITTTHSQAAAPQSSGLVNLPSELLIKILRMLSMKEFGSLNRTCHQISFVTTNDAPLHLLSHFFPNLRKTDPDQTDLEALKQRHITHSNLTKGVYVSRTLQAHNQSVDALAIDGRRLFSGSRDNTIKIWDLNTNTCTAILEGHRDYVRCLVLNGQRLISASDDRTIKIWDLNTNTCTATLEGHDGYIKALIIDEQRLFSGSDDETIMIWDLNTNTCTATLGEHDELVSNLAFHGKNLISSSLDETIQIWDLTTNTCTATLQGHTEGVLSFVLDGQRLISSSYDKTIKIWDLNTNTCTATLKVNNEPVGSLALDGPRLIFSCVDGSIKIWDFNAPDEAVFKEIAEMMISKDPAIADDAMDRFNRMPPKAKKTVYDELHKIKGSSANDEGKDAFHNQNGQGSTPEQRAQSILNYLAERS